MSSREFRTRERWGGGMGGKVVVEEEEEFIQNRTREEEEFIHSSRRRSGRRASFRICKRCVRSFLTNIHDEALKLRERD